MITLITGNHLRHMYVADCFSKIFKDVIWVIQKREKFIPEIDKTFNSEIQKLQKIHFEKRKDAEIEFFTHKAGEVAKNKINTIIEIDKDEIINGELKKKLKKNKNEILITYGCHIISDDFLDMFKKYKWNIHGGLSPWYRGTATHFWPTYMLEPEYTGMTFHEITKDIDGGNIFHQSVSDLRIEDGIHQNACRVVKNFTDKLPHLINKKISKIDKISGIKSKTDGRIWTSRMWSPLNLNLIYNVYEDRVNKYCVENKKIKKPKIKSVFV